MLASPLNFSSRGEIALLYSLVAVTTVLGLLKSRMACEHPGPNAKAGGACAAGQAGGGGSGVGRSGCATVAAAWAGGATCAGSIFPCSGGACCA